MGRDGGRRGWEGMGEVEGIGMMGPGVGGHVAHQHMLERVAKKNLRWS